MCSTAHRIRRRQRQNGDDRDQVGLEVPREVQRIDQAQPQPQKARDGAYQPQEKRVREQPVLHAFSIPGGSYVVDWSAVVADLLEQKGATLTSSARALGMARTTLRYYSRDDGTPLHHQGELLIAHWCLVTGRPRHELPLRRRFGSAAKP